MIDQFTSQAWEALGGAPEAAGAVAFREQPGALPSRLPVLAMARATVAACSLAAAELLAERSGTEPAPVLVDEGAVDAAFRSEKLLLIDGEPGATFAPYSGFWRTADGGWVRTHANYPHHRARLLAALGLAADATPEQLGAELARRTALEVQETAYPAGALAVAVGDAVPTDHPLVACGVPGSSERRLAPAALPAAGVRVLDLTRVIAGPVATRTLGLLGADVLRVDSPRLPESADAHADTGFGKRSTLLDLAEPGDLAVLRELAEGADVVITGYRPGALDRFGLTAEQLPGAVLVQLDAWGRQGPWAGRRGFDSLVQAGTGIAMLESPDGERPGVLPAQALDHGTGYLIAAGVLRALTERQRTGRTHRLRYALAATAHWLLTAPRPEPTAGPVPAFDPAPHLTHTASPYGRLHHARSPLGNLGAPRDWPAGPGRWGTDRPEWLTG
ncbi:CoA transferase [Kitasatospora viridis]|uniref:CoA transferase family III n=1 Tax=Kitasatospora viridis TaxID=281105 RepID=A0A561UHY1_9ACTN|nr:CoA transferase [Kitasatospora viridis]TWF98962.1 CoA transferase family III [Kitasatospora viridis]